MNFDKLKFWKKDYQTVIAEELIAKDFLRTVQHYVSFPNSVRPFSFAVLPMVDGILASISRENFSTATDETGRLLFTALDKSVQLIVDYETGFMTVTIGSVFYDTFEVHEPQPVHDNFYR